MTERPTVASRAFDLGPWVKAPQAPDNPPHFREWASRLDPVNQFGIVWADERHEVPVAAIDVDGCRAVILGPSAVGSAVGDGGSDPA